MTRLRRIACSVFFMFCALFVADSASWAATEPPEPSPSSSPSEEPSPTPSADPEPTPEPTPEPEPEQMTTTTAGTEEDPTVVQLTVEQMSVFLLGLGLVTLTTSTTAVLLFGHRG